MKRAGKRFWLIAGDAFTLLIVTLIGFASHNELQWAFVGRMALSWLPFTLAWWLLAARMQLLDPQRPMSWSLTLDLTVAVFYAATVGMMVRAWVMGGVLLPVFALVMAAVAWPALWLWRWLWRRLLCPSGG